MQTIRRVFLASLFFMLTILLAIWFYPWTSQQLSEFNSTVQGGVGYDTSAYFLALGALDAGLALLCTASLFYGTLLVVRRGKTSTLVEGSKPAPAKAAGRETHKSVVLNRRFLLIPVWLVAQYLWNLFSGMSAGQALDMMTSINSLWISAVVITVVVLYARNYQVVFGNKDPEKPEPAEKSITPKP